MHDIAEPIADEDVRPGRRLRPDRVVAVALALVAAQIGFRSWAVLGSWFQFDDFSFVSRVLNNPVPAIFFEQYAGHLMPSGMGLTWLNHQLGVFDWTYPAVELIAMQALASLGCVVLLVSAFGRRWGIIPPLVVYLTSPITLPAVTWWAAGVNQVPFQIALFWGLLAHLVYLRTRRLRWVLATLAITLATLSFYEKTLTIFFVYAFFALAYFATGTLWERLAGLWRTYRWGIVLHGVVALSYTGVYLAYGRTPLPESVEGMRTPVAGVAAELVPRFFSGVTGGPVTWADQGAIWQVPDPSNALLLLSGAVVVGVVYTLCRSRSGAKRALYLPIVMLSSTIILVSTSRALFVGTALAQDFRYQTEMSAVAAIALALMAMPVRGAADPLTQVEPDKFADSPLFVGALTAVVGAVGIYSSVVYVNSWHSRDQARVFFTNAQRELTASPAPVPLVDAAVPDFISLPFAWPENSLRHMFRSFEDHTRYPVATLDELFMVDDRGRIRPMQMEPLRRGSDQKFPCPHPVEDGAATIELDGPVMGAGYWVRLEYSSTKDADITLVGGTEQHDLSAPSGLHNVFFQASGEFSTVRVEGFAPQSDACVREVELGLPHPLPVNEDQ